MPRAEADYRLDDHVVIVTGVSSGLGRWIAEGLDAAGARLVLTARRAPRVEELAGSLEMRSPCPETSPWTPTGRASSSRPSTASAASTAW